MSESREIVRKIISEDVKRRIVKEIESGQTGQTEASRLYQISRPVIQKWLKKYGKLHYETRIVEIVMKEEKGKIEELQQALADAHLKLRLYDKMLELAGKEHNTDFKKNFSTQASELLKSKAAKSKGYAK